MNDEQLTQRIRAASEAIEMSDRAQAGHLEAISAALSDTDAVPLSSARSTRRRPVIASIVAVAMLAPAGLAAASEDSVPGDSLYGVKQLSEKVLVLFDSDIVARHRIEEIEALEDAGRIEPRLYEDAREALSELGEDHPLWERLSAPTAAPADEDEADSSPDDDDDRSQAGPIAPARLALDLPDGTEATITVEAGRIVDIAAPAGWAVSEIDDDEATLKSASYEVEIEVDPDGTVRTEVTARVDIDDDSASDDPDVDNDGDTGSTGPQDSAGDSGHDSEDDSSDDPEVDSGGEDGDSPDADPEDDSASDDG
jgi:hypothetical protein